MLWSKTAINFAFPTIVTMMTLTMERNNELSQELSSQWKGLIGENQVIEEHFANSPHFFRLQNTSEKEW